MNFHMPKTLFFTWFGLDPYGVNPEKKNSFFIFKLQLLSVKVRARLIIHRRERERDSSWLNRGLSQKTRDDTDLVEK